MSALTIALASTVIILNRISINFIFLYRVVVKLQNFKPFRDFSFIKP